MSDPVPGRPAQAGGWQAGLVGEARPAGGREAAARGGRLPGGCPVRRLQLHRLLSGSQPLYDLGAGKSVAAKEHRFVDARSIGCMQQVEFVVGELCRLSQAKEWNSLVSRLGLHSSQGGFG